MTAPDVTVAVPSHDRPARLRALLDALDRQSLPEERYEVVVCHDYAGDSTELMLVERERTRPGRFRALAIPPGSGGPALQRNLAWRGGAAPLVAFVDDDCRPEPGWLEALLEAARSSPGAIVEGTTRPDPDEVHLVGLPYSRTLDIDPPSRFANTCNILYPRELLERLSGFDEGVLSSAGEDTDLMLRARELGAGHVGAPDALVWHAVDGGSLTGRLRTLPRWQTLALVAKRHPGIRRGMPLGIFWKPAHVVLLPAIAGIVLAGATRRSPWLLLALPWVRQRGVRYGLAPRPLAASARDTLGRLVVDVAELAVMVRGSLRYRTLLL